jgi:hypothetical protein
MTNKVRVGQTYIYSPKLLDKIDGRTNLQDGETVRVVNIYGCPRANTMGHCYVNRLDGTWGGLVHCNSLHTKAEYIEYLKREIAKRESNRPTMRQFQVRELNGEFSIVWHDDANHCIREGYNRFKTHAEAVNDANSLESGSITPKHWPIIAND